MECAWPDPYQDICTFFAPIKFVEWKFVVFCPLLRSTKPCEWCVIITDWQVLLFMYNALCASIHMIGSAVCVPNQPKLPTEWIQVNILCLCRWALCYRGQPSTKSYTETCEHAVCVKRMPSKRFKLTICCPSIRLGSVVYCCLCEMLFTSLRCVVSWAQHKKKQNILIIMQARKKRWNK